MKFIPILLSTEMVLAEQAGRKTKTRRTKGLEKINEAPDNWNFISFGTNPDDENDKRLFAFFQEGKDGPWMKILCPYGQLGSVLWVRETLHQTGELGLEYYADNELIAEDIIPNDYGPYGGEYSFRNIPSIHMPKWACRTFLKVTDIRLEHLQDITDSDAISEGIEPCGPPFNDVKKYGWRFKDYLNNSAALPKSSFQSLWSKINGSENWNANPWVWVISFKRIDKPENFI